jgi:hypothetical protein
LLWESPEPEDITDVREHRCFVVFVAKLTPDYEGGLKLFDGFLLLVQSIVGGCDGGEASSFRGAIAGFPVSIHQLLECREGFANARGVGCESRAGGRIRVNGLWVNGAGCDDKGKNAYA